MNNVKQPGLSRSAAFVCFRSGALCLAAFMLSVWLGLLPVPAFAQDRATSPLVPGRISRDAAIIDNALRTMNKPAAKAQEEETGDTPVYENPFMDYGIDLIGEDEKFYTASGEVLIRKIDIAADLPWRRPSVNPDSVTSLFFTAWTRQLIREVRQGGIFALEPEPSELRKDAAVPKTWPKPQGMLALSGISYHSNDNWTIWLNGKRITPNALPKEVLDLKVRRNYIDVKWFDSRSNTVFPVRLRPHQRFDLSSRMFLPG